MKKRSVAMLAIPVATSMLVLSGCSGDSKPDASPTGQAGATSSSPASTAAPSTTSISPSPANIAPKPDPGIPAAARVANIAGAQAFTRYFIKRWNDAWTGPRTGILTPLCHPTSEACAVYEKEAARLAKKGLRYNGDPVSVKSLTVQESARGRMVDILAVMVQEPRSQVNAAGKVIRTEKRKDFGSRFVLLHTGKSWSITFIQSSK
jgi:hypothetical protein